METTLWLHILATTCEKKRQRLTEGRYLPTLFCSGFQTDWKTRVALTTPISRHNVPSLDGGQLRYSTWESHVLLPGQEITLSRSMHWNCDNSRECRLSGTRVDRCSNQELSHALGDCTKEPMLARRLCERLNISFRTAMAKHTLSRSGHVSFSAAKDVSSSPLAGASPSQNVVKPLASMLRPAPLWTRAPSHWELHV